MNLIKSFFRTLLLIIVLPLCGGELYDPIALYLTWQHSPQTTITVQWITDTNRTDDIVEYQRIGEETWHKARGMHSHLPEGLSLYIHRAELYHLEPCTEYRFRTGVDAIEYKFRTLPNELTSPLVFIEGGDVYHDDIREVQKMNKQAALQRPAFAVLGGDIAYSFSGRLQVSELAGRWMTFLTAWKQTMVTPDGFLIPIVPAIGNHEVQGGFGQTPSAAPMYYALFSLPGQQGYYVLDFCKYLSLFILDSGHTHPIDGQQKDWLNHALSIRKACPHKLAIYHIGAYPSVRDFNNSWAALVRENWVPLFEKFGVQVAFEHHDHAFKRTFPICAGQKAEGGVIYIGDGAWGVDAPRVPKTTKNAWYLEKTAQVRVVNVVTLFPDNSITFRAMDPFGQTIDEFKLGGQ